ncbi:MAG: transporter substrate-binding domain-containing protein [Desulfovibrio sp.]|nr:transporter substrate-binding domain-containing protein [Desulfovibrio sp.]
MPSLTRLTLPLKLRRPALTGALACLLLLAFCLLTPAPAQAASEKLPPSLIDKVLDRGVLRVGFSSFVPWAMQDKNGEFIGFEVDVARRLAKDLGVELQLVPTRWSGIIPALLADKFDIIIGSMSVTPERNLKGNFTIPYDYATIEAVANKEKTKGMKFPEDYNKPEVVIAVRSGSTPALAAKKLFPEATLRPFDDEAPAVQDVIAGRSHLMLSSAPLPAFSVLRNPEVLYQPTTEAISRQPVGFLIRKGDVDSLNVLDNWIRMAEEEGWLKDRRNYWFHSTDWEKLVR